MIGSIFRKDGEKPDLDLVFHGVLADKAANLLGNFKAASQNAKSGIGQSLVYAARLTAEEIGATGTLDDLIAAGARASILEAAQKATEFSIGLVKSSEDPKLALASDAFAAIAVLCYGNQGFYRPHPDLQSIFTMTATLYGYAKAADDLG